MSENSPYDLQQALRNVGGSEELLQSLAQLFAEECRKQLADLQQGYREASPQAVSRAAHALKGSLALLAAGDAADAARAIEVMGRSGDLAAFDAAWSHLQQELNRLMQALNLPSVSDGGDP